MDKIKGLFSLLFSFMFSGVIGLFGSFLAIIGPLYWIWIAIQISSWWMFALGFCLPFLPFTALIGVYSLLFGVPDWIFNTFASTSIVS